MRKRPSQPVSVLLLSFLLLSLAAAGMRGRIVAAEPVAKDRPNIVLIIADDK